MPKKLTKFERKEGFYCDLTQEQINAKDNGIDFDKLHYENLGPNKSDPRKGNTYFVYYDSLNIDKEISQRVMGRIYAAIRGHSHYANEHVEDMKWCQENKDVLQPLIKKEFDDKFGKYGEDFKFDLDIFNYAFLSNGRDSITLVSLDNSTEDKPEKSQLTIANEEIDKLMRTAAENNTELDLKSAINQMSKKLEDMEHVASSDGCRKAMKLAMAHYAHKIMELDISKEEKKNLFGDILVSYKDTMTTMIATIGGYDKGYSVGNIDFGCLKGNNLINDLNEVVPTKFFIDVDKNADKNKDIDTVIENSLKNKTLKVEDKEFIGQSYKVAKEKYDRHNDFVKWLSKIPLLFPSVKKEREAVEKIESFADKFDLGKTKKERLENLTGITEAKKKKVVIDMADKFVKSAEIDVNGVIKTMEGIFGKAGLAKRFRSITDYQKKEINDVMNRFYAGNVLDKISKLPGVSEYYSPIDKQEVRAVTQNDIYKRYIAETADQEITYEEKDQFVYAYEQASEYSGRETDILSVSIDGKSGKSIEFSLEKEVVKADAQLAKLGYDVLMKGTEVKVEQNYVSEQKDFKGLSDLANDVSTNNKVVQQEKNNTSLNVEKITEKGGAIKGSLNK